MIVRRHFASPRHLIRHPLIGRETKRLRTMSTETLPTREGECKMILPTSSESFSTTTGYASDVGGRVHRRNYQRRRRL